MEDSRREAYGRSGQSVDTFGKLDPMLLLTGPAGSGKSFAVLEAFRESLRKSDTGVRLLVPTATMAHHLRNQIAREGFVFRPGLIQTLSRFIDAWTADLPEVSSAVLYLLVEQAVAKVAPARVRECRAHARIFRCSRAHHRRMRDGGFGLAQTCALFAGHGIGATRFSPCIAKWSANSPRAGWRLRAGRLERAASAIEQSGLAKPAHHLDGWICFAERSGTGPRARRPRATPR